MTPLGNRIIVKPLPYKQPGKVQIPDAYRETLMRQDQRVYEVVKVGPGRKLRNGTMLPIDCAPGDTVITHSYTDGPSDLPDGVKIIDADMVIAVVPKPNNQTKP